MGKSDVTTSSKLANACNESGSVSLLFAWSPEKIKQYLKVTSVVGASFKRIVSVCLPERPS